MSALPRTADIVIIGSFAAGEMVSDLLTIGKTSLDISDLRLNRS